MQVVTDGFFVECTDALLIDDLRESVILYNTPQTDAVAPDAFVRNSLRNTVPRQARLTRGGDDTVLLRQVLPPSGGGNDTKRQALPLSSGKDTRRKSPNIKKQDGDGRNDVNTYNKAAFNHGVGSDTVVVNKSNRTMRSLKVLGGKLKYRKVQSRFDNDSWRKSTVTVLNKKDPVLDFRLGDDIASFQKKSDLNVGRDQENLQPSNQIKRPNSLRRDEQNITPMSSIINNLSVGRGHSRHSTVSSVDKSALDKENKYPRSEIKSRAGRDLNKHVTPTAIGVTKQAVASAFSSSSVGSGGGGGGGTIHDKTHDKRNDDYYKIKKNANADDAGGWRNHNLSNKHNMKNVDSAEKKNSGFPNGNIGVQLLTAYLLLQEVRNDKLKDNVALKRFQDSEVRG